jgi:hypothetical protein
MRAVGSSESLTKNYFSPSLGFEPPHRVSYTNTSRRCVVQNGAIIALLMKYRCAMVVPAVESRTLVELRGSVCPSALGCIKETTHTFLRELALTVSKSHTTSQHRPYRAGCHQRPIDYLLISVNPLVFSHRGTHTKYYQQKRDNATHRFASRFGHNWERPCTGALERPHARGTDAVASQCHLTQPWVDQCRSRGHMPLPPRGHHPPRCPPDLPRTPRSARPSTHQPRAAGAMS